ncbi:MAG: hypothetical protein WDW36_000937 [Sanguina aurantia]
MSVSSCTLAVALLISIVALGSNSVHAQNGSLQLHGSGTANTAPFLLKLMELFSVRTKPQATLTYRSIGFRRGRHPPTTSQYQSLTVTGGQAMLHVPYLLNKIGVFHNLPGLTQVLQLSGCTLAGIFAGNITTWNDALIQADNPGATPFPSAPVTIAHLPNGFSATYALSSYLSAACPSAWTLGSGFNVDWSGSPSAVVVSSPDAMEAHLSTHRYSIGYLAAAKGLEAGLREVSLPNADNLFLTSAASDEIGNSTMAGLPTDLSVDWSNVTFSYQAGAGTWPLTLMSYFYLRQDSTFLGAAGGLLQAFVTFVLSDEAQLHYSVEGLIPLPSTSRQAYSTSVALNMRIAAVDLRRSQTRSMRDFIDRRHGDHAGFRRVPVDRWRLLCALVHHQPIDEQLHGSGSYSAASYIRQVQQALHDSARAPITVSYRISNPVSTAKEFLDYQGSINNLNHFKVGDVPLSTSNWSALSTGSALAVTGGPCQVPIAISLVSLFYNQAVPSGRLVLDCGTLASIYSGSLTKWSDSRLAQPNGWTTDYPQALDSYLSYPIVVYAYSGSNANSDVMVSWWQQSCPGSFAAADGNVKAALDGFPSSVPVTTTFGGAPILTADDMAAAISGTPHSLGYVQSSLGVTAGLVEANLMNRDGVVQKSPAASAQAAILANMVSDLTLDWSLISPSSYIDQTGQQTWPLTNLIFVYVFCDLTPFMYAGPLVKAMFSYIFSDVGQTLAIANGLGVLPNPMLSSVALAAQQISVAPLSQEWVFELGGQNGSGVELFSFSANRYSYENEQLDTLLGKVGSLQKVVKALTVTLTAAGDDSVKNLTAMIASNLQDFATSPFRLSFEVGARKGSSSRGCPGALDRRSAPRGAGYTRLLPSTLPLEYQDNFLIRDRPLTTPEWQELTFSSPTGPCGPVLQIPFFIRPVAILYRATSRGADNTIKIQMSPCLLARVVKGDVSTWSDPLIQAENPTSVFPANRISVVYCQNNTGDVQAVLAYLALACPSIGPLTLPANPGYVSADELALSVGTSPVFSLLALVSTAYTYGYGLNEVWLPGSSAKNAEYVFPSKFDSSSFSANMNDMFEIKGAAALGFPSDATSDWANFTIVGKNQEVYALWPILRMDFILVTADLTRFSAVSSAIVAAITYMTQSYMTDEGTTLGAQFSPPGANVAAYILANYLPQFVITPTAVPWVVLASAVSLSSDPAVLKTSPQAFITSRATASAYSLQGQVSLLRVLNLVNASLVTVTSDLRSGLTTQILTSGNKSDLAFGLAIAAIVLTLLLCTVAIVLGAVALAKIHKIMKILGKSPAGTKYSTKKADMDAASYVEMSS